jgi:hypothetical protein
MNYLNINKTFESEYTLKEENIYPISTRMTKHTFDYGIYVQYVSIAITTVKKKF